MIINVIAGRNRPATGTEMPRKRLRRGNGHDPLPPEIARQPIAKIAAAMDRPGQTPANPDGEGLGIRDFLHENLGIRHAIGPWHQFEPAHDLPVLHGVIDGGDVAGAKAV